MYPAGELNRLAVRRSLLSRRIDLRRRQCAEHGAKLVQPLKWLDRMLGTWRRISPVAKVLGPPLLLVLVRKFFDPIGRAGRLVSWLRLAPLALRLARR